MPLDENALNSVAVQIPPLPVFDPASQNWKIYRDRISFHFAAYDVQDDFKKKALFLSSIGFNTYELLESLLAPKTLIDNAVKYSDIVAKFDEHYRCTKNILLGTYEFYNCLQKSGQSINDWMAELREKARHCGFTDSALKEKPLDRALRDMLVIGTINPNIRQALLKEKDPTLEAALNIARSAEQLQTDVKQFSTPMEKEIAAISTKPKFVKRDNAQKSSPSAANKFPPCGSCGFNNHVRDDCKYRQATCFYCGSIGHIPPVCKKKKANEQAGKSTNSAKPLAKPKQNFGKLHSVISQVKQSSRITVPDLSINGRPIILELDTGADCSVLTVDDWVLIGSPKLSPNILQLKNYGGGALDVLGDCQVTVRYNSVEKLLPITVVKPTDSNTASIIGLDWIQNFKFDLNNLAYQRPNNLLNISSISTAISPKLQQVLDSNRAVFAAGLGHCTKMKAHLSLKQNASPIIYKPRKVPFSRLEGIKAELQRNVDAGILTPVDTATWAAPIVPVLKPNDKIRICGDFKVTVNPFLLVDQHPLPTIDEVLVKLKNGQKFTKLDLADAYLQIGLDEESKQFVCINTPFGLYQYNRLPFGIANAPAIFQRLVDKLLADIPHCGGFFDDVIITGENDDDHLRTLDTVLKRFADYGLRCKLEKCQFFQDEVSYLGYKINRFGKRPDPARTDAIRDMPEPKSVKDIEVFLGKLNYYGRFIKNLAELSAPLNRLRRKNANFVWSSDCQRAFKQLKQSLINSTTLVHYDMKLPLILATDASQNGIGAVLSHRYPDGSEKPIAFASKTLTSAEIRYSQIEKEALGIYYGIIKFNQYVSGRSFELITDHKPLVSIFSPDKALPAYTHNRLQRYAIALMGYSFNIRYRPTAKHVNADALSRLAAGDDINFIDKISTNIIASVRSLINSGPINYQLLKTETANCKLLQTIIRLTNDGLLSKMSSSSIDREILPFQQRCQKLSVNDDCLFFHDRVVIPVNLRQRILKVIHADHSGSVRMKIFAQQHCWWPSIDTDIERVARSCDICATVAPAPPAKCQAWPEAQAIWSRVHVDFAGPFLGEKWLVVIDSKSKYAFIQPMGLSTTASALISQFKLIFQVTGPCSCIVSDNGPPFNSYELKQFYKLHGIQHITTVPYHPASNGLAERLVRSFKEAMRKFTIAGLKKYDALDKFLQSYRFRPHSSTNFAPAELFFQRKVPTELSQLKKPAIIIHPSNSESNPVKFHLGDLIWARQWTQNKTFWNSGVIVKLIGSKLLHLKMDDGSIIKRHYNQVKSRLLPDEPSDNSNLNSSPIPLIRQHPVSAAPRRSSRQRRQPAWYSP